MKSLSKINGVVYTPKYIANFIVSRLNDLTLEDTILEPSVGQGVFIEALLEYVKNKFHLAPEEELDWFFKKVFAGDIDKNSVEAVKNNLFLYFKNKGLSVSANSFSKNIFVEDFLTTSKTYSFIIGNPPYVRIQNMNDNYVSKIKAKFSTCKSGNVDLYFAFVEHALNLSTKKMAFIIPNSFFSTNSGRILRKKLSTNIDELVDFECEKVFPGVGTYTTIIIAQPKEVNSFKLFSPKLDGTYIQQLKSVFFQKNGWCFTQNKVQAKTNGTSLKQLAVFHSPVATLRDKIFIKTIEQQQTLKLETDLMVPCFKLTKTSVLEFQNPKNVIIFPYRDGKILTRTKLDGTRIIQYLSTQRKLLDARDAGKTEKHEDWYAYGRKQGLAPYKEGTTLILLPQMFRNISNDMVVIDNNRYENFAFTSGFIIEIEKEKAEKIIEELKSPQFNDYLISKSKKWPGNYYTFSIKALKDYLI